jgi:hypothetical protein
MKEQLAEQLLARAMNWGPEQLAQERPILQALAAYKYDEYQRYFPGQRFIETLALWLNDLETQEEKDLAYGFVRKELIFFSSAEIHHLVSIAYPDLIRPTLLRAAAAEANINQYHVRRIAASREFRIEERSCLFLGLSDGARTDIFRRCNESIISHEQVLQTYEISAERVGKLLKKLDEDLRARVADCPKDPKFRTLVLLDDFSASGTSYLRFDESKLRGKISDFSENLLNAEHPNSTLVTPSQLRILLVLYIASNKAVDHLKTHLGSLWAAKSISYEILVVHPLPDEIKIGQFHPLAGLLTKYYDPSMEDEHTRKGGCPITFGYAGCGLPLVMGHNTPNNSIYPLWKKGPRLRALFPRGSRHTSA